MAEVFYRLSYRLRKVIKAPPLIKIPETDAIFVNFKKTLASLAASVF